MKILFDENVPKKLKRDLEDFSIFTVQELGWEGKDNGVLLEAMLSDHFDVLITGDKNMENQQNFANIRYLFFYFVLVFSCTQIGSQ